MGHIPGTTERRWYERSWVVDAIAVVPPIIAGSVSAWASLHDPSRDSQILGRILALGLVWLIVASVIKVMHAFTREQHTAEAYDGLEGALQVLYAVISGHCGITVQEKGRLRVTILRVVPAMNPGGPVEELEQLLPYIGGSGKGPGRRFSIRSGIVGRAVREQATFTASHQHAEYGEFLREMVIDWGYTMIDAHALTADRQSWMAVPIIVPQGVVAVVYLDSDTRDFFTADVQRLVINSCHGVAGYVDVAY